MVPPRRTLDSPQSAQRSRRKKGTAFSASDCTMPSYCTLGICKCSCFILCVLCALCALCGETVAQNDVPQVVPVDGAAFAGKLVSVSADHVATFQAADKTPPVTIKLEDLVRWGNSVPLKPQTVVVLADGGRIVTAADWSGGAAVRLEGDQVVILSDAWNEFRLPRRMVSGVVFAQRNQEAARELLIERVRAFRKAEGAPNNGSSGAGNADIWLTNGNRVSGDILKLEKGSLAVRASTGETTLPLSRVEAIAWDANTGAAHLRSEKQFVVGMRDGSLVLAKSITATEKEVAVELADGITIKGASVADIALLQSLGGRFEYFSDVEKLDYRFVPYLAIEWPLARDRNVLGGPLEVGGQRYLKGLGIHSAARVTCRFEREYERFDALAAIDDAAKRRGSVVFGAHVLRDDKWVEAFTSDMVRGGEPPRPVSVDLRGAKGLTLTVDYADRGDELDYADWLDARLVKLDDSK